MNKREKLRDVIYDTLPDLKKVAGWRWTGQDGDIQTAVSYKRIGIAEVLRVLYVTLAGAYFIDVRGCIFTRDRSGVMRHVEGRIQWNLKDDTLEGQDKAVINWLYGIICAKK